MSGQQEFLKILFENKKNMLFSGDAFKGYSLKVKSEDAQCNILLDAFMKKFAGQEIDYDESADEYALILLAYIRYRHEEADINTLKGATNILGICADTYLDKDIEDIEDNKNTFKKMFDYVCYGLQNYVNPKEAVDREHVMESILGLNVRKSLIAASADSKIKIQMKEKIGQKTSDELREYARLRSSLEWDNKKASSQSFLPSKTSVTELKDSKEQPATKSSASKPAKQEEENELKRAMRESLERRNQKKI